MTLTCEQSNSKEFRWVLTANEDRSADEVGDALNGWLNEHPNEPAQLWIRHLDEPTERVAKDLGFVPYRDLWQLRCSLPQTPSQLHTWAFTPSDITAFVSVNNRAFHWHPEQGGLTVEALQKTLAEDWFNADGFRLARNEEGRLMGFCWTKIHRDSKPHLGEIYVIAVDPDFHGRGLGRALTLAGLEWLSNAGLNMAMLYVESDNGAANAIYAAIGFSHHHTDRAYRRTK